MSLIAVFLIGFVIFCVLLAGTVAIIVGSMRKSKWGINAQGITCPRCGTVQPQVRKPTSIRQAMWGGSTCPSCGLELDKWGRPVKSA